MQFCSWTKKALLDFWLWLGLKRRGVVVVEGVAKTVVEVGLDAVVEEDGQDQELRFDVLDIHIEKSFIDLLRSKYFLSIKITKSQWILFSPLRSVFLCYSAIQGFL